MTGPLSRLLMESTFAKNTHTHTQRQVRLSSLIFYTSSFPCYLLSFFISHSNIHSCIHRAVITSDKGLSGLTTTAKAIFCRPLSCCLHVERTQQPQWVHPTRGVKGHRVPVRWDEKIDGVHLLVQACVCVYAGRERGEQRERNKAKWKMREKSRILTRGQRAPWSNSAQMLTRLLSQSCVPNSLVGVWV